MCLCRSHKLKPCFLKIKFDYCNNRTFWFLAKSSTRKILPIRVTLQCYKLMFSLLWYVHAIDRFSNVIGILFLVQNFRKYSTGRGSSVSSDATWDASGTEIDSLARHILSLRYGHEYISTAIRPLPQIQEILAKECTLSTGKLIQGGLPSNSVVRINGRPDMTSTIYCRREASYQGNETEKMTHNTRYDVKESFVNSLHVYFEHAEREILNHSCVNNMK